MKKLIFLLAILIPLSTFAQLPSAIEKKDLVTTINSSEWKVYFGSGVQPGNIGYNFHIQVSSTGKVKASWINGKFEGQLYADGRCVGIWRPILKLFTKLPMEFTFTQDIRSAMGRYTDQTGKSRLIRIKKK